METPAHATNESLRMRCAELEMLNHNLELLNTELKQQIIEISDKTRWLEEQLRLAVHRRYSPSSERYCSGQMLLDLCEDVASAQAATVQAELVSADEEEKTTRSPRKWRKQREAKLKNLEVETVEYRLPEHECVCPHCDGALHEMSKEIQRELKITPPEVSVVEPTCYVYSCRHCESNHIETPILTAPMPDPVISGSLASPSALAYIMSQKFVDGLPLYRQEKQLQRFGVELSRQTMANWMLRGAQWLDVLHDRLHHELLQRDVLHADETHLQVLREPGRSAKTNSYLWLYRSSRAGPAIILFDYQQTRAAEHPRRFLSGFSGYLHADGYVGYEGLPNVELVGCWAHARRKFAEAAKSLPPSSKSSTSVKPAALEGLEFCQALFKIEKELKDLTDEERHAARQERSRPIVERFRQWLEQKSHSVLPKGLLGTAVGYCLNQWDKLTTFLKDGRLELSNNRAENSIRPVVVGRKNWLFANTPEGARASATIYSIVETAKENGVNPLSYLTYLFEQLPNQNLDDPAVVGELLPWSPTIKAKCQLIPDDSRQDAPAK